jgi:hypothetical protein
LRDSCTPYRADEPRPRPVRAWRRRLRRKHDQVDSTKLAHDAYPCTQAVDAASRCCKESRNDNILSSMLKEGLALHTQRGNALSVRLLDARCVPALSSDRPAGRWFVHATVNSLDSPANHPSATRVFAPGLCLWFPGRRKPQALERAATLAQPRA